MIQVHLLLCYSVQHLHQQLAICKIRAHRRRRTKHFTRSSTHLLHCILHIDVRLLAVILRLIDQSLRQRLDSAGKGHPADLCLLCWMLVSITPWRVFRLLVTNIADGRCTAIWMDRRAFTCVLQLPRMGKCDFCESASPKSGFQD